MAEQRNWQDSSLAFNLTKGEQQFKQNLTNVIADPSDDQITTVGRALAALNPGASLIDAALTVHSQLIFDQAN